MLMEISGITFHEENNDTIYAEQDEEGKIFYLDQHTGQYGDLKFGKPGDYEDISISKDQVILLRSDGTLFGIPLAEVQRRDIRTVNKWEHLLPAGEYEGMYADKDRVYILCKSGKPDKNKEAVSGYVFLLVKGRPEPAGTFSISGKDIARLSASKKHFKPAALAKNQRTREWYILSSVNKMLVITDEHWNVKDVFKLDPKLFVQPEGIAFDSDHTLYIANEGSDVRPGTILKFLFRPIR